MLLGKLLFNAAFAVVSVGVCMAAGYGSAGGHRAVAPAAWLPIAFWSVLGTAGWYFLFTWLALNLRGFNAYHTTTSALYLVLMFVSNLFYPTQQLPGCGTLAGMGECRDVADGPTALLHLCERLCPPSGSSRLGRLSFLFWSASGWQNRKLNGTIE